METDFCVIDKWCKDIKDHDRDISLIKESVVHHTDGDGTITTLKKWMMNPGQPWENNYKKGVGLTHFEIDREGAIWQASPLTEWWWHSDCGGTAKTTHDRETIGIELIHKTGTFTDKQYESLNWLLFQHLPKICVNYNRIVSHDYNNKKYSNKTKGCPGNDFDWQRVWQGMLDADLKFGIYSKFE